MTAAIRKLITAIVSAAETRVVSNHQSLNHSWLMTDGPPFGMIVRMPVIARFYGIAIRMYSREHGVPRTQVTYRRVRSVRPLVGRRLLVAFATGEQRVYDCGPLLAESAFAALVDETVFQQMRADRHGQGVVRNPSSAGTTIRKDSDW